MSHSLRRARGSRRSGERGYLIVLFVIILAFVGTLAAMHLLVLTSVGTTSRAYDAYRQGATEAERLQHAVAEATFDLAQWGAITPTPTLAQALSARIANASGGGSELAITLQPTGLPTVNGYPQLNVVPDPVVALSAADRMWLTPELSRLVGDRAAIYRESVFRFSSSRTAADAKQTYTTEVRARLFAVPLTRFPVAAYDLPSEIGALAANRSSGPASALPPGLVPARDPSFLSDLQPQTGVLPYHFRSRAALATAYQYLWSQAFIDRMAEYAGVAHVCDLAATSGTATPGGLVRNGNAAAWDIAQADTGTYDSITTATDATVVYTESGGYSLRLYDSAGNQNTSALCLMILGPSNATTGTLTLQVGPLARPVLILAYNVTLSVPVAAGVNGAIFLDPVSTCQSTAPLSVGHVSYWAGSKQVTAASLNATGAIPAAVEAIAPRVVYVATTATRL